MHIIELNLDNKYFYIKIYKIILNILNKKILIKILDLYNQKKSKVLVE